MRVVSDATLRIRVKNLSAVTGKKPAGLPVPLPVLAPG
jgi:hypothetical protein